MTSKGLLSLSTSDISGHVSVMKKRKKGVDPSLGSVNLLHVSRGKMACVAYALTNFAPALIRAV